MSILSSFKSWLTLLNKICACTLLGIALCFIASTTRAEDPVLTSISSVLEYANTLYSEKKFDAARQQFDHALELDKGSLSAWRGLGWSHWAMGQKERAYKIWSDLIKAFPEDMPTLLTLGKASEQDQHLDEANDYYAQMLELNPHDQTAHLGRARIFIIQHKFQDAEQHARAAVNDEPSNNDAKSLLAEALIWQDRNQEAESILRILAQAKPIPDNLNRLGKVLAKLGQYEQAADYYKTSLSVQADEGTLNAWRGLGVSLRKLNQNQRAYAIWQSLLHAFPNDLPTLLALGRASQQDGLWQQGLDFYKQILQKEPGNSDAHLSRAKIFFAQQDYKAAESEIKSVLNQSPSDTKARFALVENLVAIGRRDEAERILRPLVDADPVSKNLNRLGTLLADLDRENEALGYFQKSLQLDPDDVSAVTGIARCYWKDQRYSDSIELFERYLTKHPDNDVVRVALVGHAIAASNWDQAERELKTLIAKYPEETKWKTKLAILLHNIGHDDKAINLANEIIIQDPNNVNATALLADDALFNGDIQSSIRWNNRLVTLAPTPERLIGLAKSHVQLGGILEQEGKHDAAVIQYAAATQAFRQADTLDPIRSQASVLMLESLRLQGAQTEAIELGKKLHDKYPNSTDIIKQLAISYRDQGDYTAARKTLELNIPFFPGSMTLKQNIAELTYLEGEKEKSFNMLNELMKTYKNHPVVPPILLYHGLSISDRENTMSVKNFRDQLLTLKQEGYQSITVAQLLGFLEGKTVLPSKPIFITFDDSRTDSYLYADPVLMETGFQATMFVPTGYDSMLRPFAAGWPTVKKMFETGRWDLQCHAAQAHLYIPTNAAGHMGHFLTNKKWLVDAARLETNEEYAARINGDFRTCIEDLTHEVPGTKVLAFAFPYGDQGHKSINNAQDGYKTNQSLVKKNFRLAFNADDSCPIASDSDKFTLPRFDVPRTFTGKDLIRQLKASDPILSTSYKLAHLDVESGRYGQALEIYDNLIDKGSIDNAQLLTTTGKILSWNDDHAGARERLEKAIMLQPNNPVVQQEIAELDHRLKPVLQFGSLYYEDNAHRSYYSFSPSAKFAVSDRLSLSAYYKYLDFNQTLISTKSGTAQQRFQAIGNQFEGQLNYELGSRSLLSLSAGAADFSGHTSPIPSKSGSTVPLGSIKLTGAVGDLLDLSIAADHTYVNTAGAILNGITFSRVQGGFKVKLLDSLSLSANHAYFHYTDQNQRNRTQVDLESIVWDDPGITIGAQFIRDNTLKINSLFWTPNNYLAFSTPIGLKKKWGRSLVAEISVAPGFGKEANSDFKFQINTTGSLSWNVTDDFSAYVSAGQYQASTYSNFSLFAGVSLRF